jgi:3-dehydroquinate synthase
MIETLRLDLGPRSYDIQVGSGLLADAGSLMRPLLAAPRVFVVTDRNVERLHLARLSASLDAAGLAHPTIVVEPGERAKSFQQLEQLLEQLLAAGCERSTTLVAFGGGVIGDLVGFAASILLRGVPFIQIPTTLLAQVDSSVGGKTGINSTTGKNLVGSFHQPRLVLADIDMLGTLDARDLRSGYAEVVKYGLIDDPGFFAWLEAHAAALLAGDQTARRHAVLTSCAAKARIVGADEREGGVRALLNLGHTFAHALEAETGYGDALRHGEAVSIGLVLAFAVSARLGLCPADDVGRLRRHLESIAMPVALPALPGVRWTVEGIERHFVHDKKVKDGRVAFVLARGIGQAFQAREVPADMVRAVLEDAVAATAHGGTAS